VARLLIRRHGSGAGVGGNQGTIVITDSTFTGNLMGAMLHGHGTLTVRRSSMWGNSGALAVFSDSGNELLLINSTVTDNLGTTGGVRVVQSATLNNVTIFSNTRTSNLGPADWMPTILWRCPSAIRSSPTTSEAIVAAH